MMQKHPYNRNIAPKMVPMLLRVMPAITVDGARTVKRNTLAVFNVGERVLAPPRAIAAVTKTDN